MWSSFSSLSDVIKKNVEKKGFAKQVENTLILEEFNKIAEKIWDKEIAAEMKAVYIKNKILFVAVLNSILSQEIKMRENLILSELTRKFGKGKVNGVRSVI